MDDVEDVGDHCKGVMQKSLRETLWSGSNSSDFLSKNKCPNTSDKVYNPQVVDDHKPRVGQEFESLNDVHEFYNKYAKEGGFSVRMNSSRRNRDNEIVRKEYVCSKEGITCKDEDSQKKRRRGIVREGCKAKLAVVKSKLGAYVVSIFAESHNHPLATPERVHLLRSHRRASETKKSLTEELSAVSIPSKKDEGGKENIGCTQKDIDNYETMLLNEMKKHDVEMLIEHFQFEQEKNPSFTFQMEFDNENQLTHCFWADSASRRAYTYFGDVVVFDTTYNTNRYDMIFVPVMGVNNYGQTIIFACAFLSDVTTDSYIWLFEQFKKVMSISHPKMIITCEDPAMSRAISDAFPNSFHRFCVWHILDKLSEKLNAVIYRDRYEDFQKCILESEICVEFDIKWMEIVKKNNLHDNGWLQLMYEMRSKWVPAYVNHLFSAGMSSGQCAENSHVFFKRYVSNKNSLLDFVTRFNRALAHQYHEELSAFHSDLNEKPVLKLPLEVEKQMADIYTCKIFYKFQDELWDSLLHVIELRREDANQCVYKVEKRSEKGCTVREIVIDKNLDFASCNCKKYESEGIPCRHILAYLRNMQIVYLPNQYIMNRWSKDAKFKKVLEGGEMKKTDLNDNSLHLRRSRLLQLASDVIDNVTSEEAFTILTDSLEAVLEKVRPLFENCKSERVFEKRDSEKESYPSDESCNEPLQVRAKRCGKRLKGVKKELKS